MRNYLTLIFALGLLETCLQIASNYRELLLFWAGPFPVVVLLSPEYVQVR